MQLSACGEMVTRIAPTGARGPSCSPGPVVGTEAEHWTDYDRAMPYGDSDVTFDPNDAPVATEQMRHLEGFGLPAQQTVSTAATQYLHGDLIRSTMLTTGQGGTAVTAVSYTAFGEVIGTAPDTRYQYAGGWGYESDLLILEGAPGTTPITLQHVGFRWYDPSIGRFIQRDPIGLAGGLNTYAYTDANPTDSVDPAGLDRWIVWDPPHVYIVVWDPIERRWKRIDFVPRPGVTLWGPGEVLIGDATRPSGRRIGSSASDDAALLDFARNLRNHYRLHYNILGFNCIWFTSILKDYPQGPPKGTGRAGSRGRPWVCFVSGTLIWTDDGPMAIDSLTVGARVQSRATQDDRMSLERVSCVSRSVATELVAIELACETIRCTPGHPFWVISEGWTRACELTPGDALLSRDGGEVRVHLVKREDWAPPAPVLNLTVEGAHTYFVGQSSVLVHNKGHW